MTPSDEHDDLDLSPHARASVFVSASIAGIGGRIKARPEDFIVEEVPAYDPCGSGEHIYLYIQKRGLSTTQMADILARHFGVRAGDVGLAGLKDRRAVTRQVVSIHTPGRSLADFPSLNHPDLQVLWADQHTNKLRRGHLRANRFAIKVRGVGPDAAPRALRTLRLLEATGVPNRAGEQRFGRLENNHLVGRAMVLGDDKAALDVLLMPASAPDGGSSLAARRMYQEGRYADALAMMPPGFITEREALRPLAEGKPHAAGLRAIGRVQRQFFLSAFQSAVFNAVLDARLAAGTLASLAEGDLAFRHDNHAVFAVDAPTAGAEDTRRRLAALEISPSGPIWGAGMLRARGATDAVEVEMLRHLGVTPEDLAVFDARSGDDMRGARRALRVGLSYPDVEAGSDDAGLYVKCSFELPPGAYATVVMAEVMKLGAAEVIAEPKPGAAPIASQTPAAGPDA